MSTKTFIERLSGNIEETNSLVEEAGQRDLSFDELMLVKQLMSSQSFAPVWEREAHLNQGLACFPPLSPFDALNTKTNKTRENKAITADKSGHYHFAQIMRLDKQPDEYEFDLFADGDVKVFVIPGAELHSSVVRHNSKPAHNDNQNERTITIKKDSEEMKFLQQYRRTDLEELYKNAKFRLNRENAMFNVADAVDSLVTLFKNNDTDTLPLGYLKTMYNGSKFGPLKGFNRVLKSGLDKGTFRRDKKNIYLNK